MERHDQDLTGCPIHANFVGMNGSPLPKAGVKRSGTTELPSYAPARNSRLDITPGPEHHRTNRCPDRFLKGPTMRATLTALVLLSASALTLAAHADTVDVMTVTGNGHTYTFDFPLVETFTYPTNLVLFVPGFTPLSETIDGASVTPTEIFIHPDQNISGPFGQVMLSFNVLDFLSFSGPYTDPSTLQTYDIYTTAFYTGSWDAFGTAIINGVFTNVVYDINIQQESTTTPTPEPPGLLLLATAGLAFTAFARNPCTTLGADTPKGPPVSPIS